MEQETLNQKMLSIVRFTGIKATEKNKAEN